MKTEFAKPIHKVKFRVCELPGAAITEGKYHGFGSKLCSSIDDSSEVFEDNVDNSGEEDKE